MIYKINPQPIPQSKRKEINEKILFVIENNKNQLSREVIFNCYTGIGGLHELNFTDYDSFHDYTEAKKEIEMGQFFTPHTLCQQMIEVLHPETNETIVDMSCGSGNFFNYLPNLENVHGIDIDQNAIKVAKYLYSEAHIKKQDIRQFQPEIKFDVVIGNPPFNLKFKYKNKDILSQFFYCLKAEEVLNPGGILMLITPFSFLNDEFWNKTQVNSINKNFSFIGQSLLSETAFKSVGVDKFATKIIIFQKKAEYITPVKYEAKKFSSLTELKIRIQSVREEKKSNKLKIVQEIIKDTQSNNFEYKMNKYLYEIKTHKILQPELSKAISYVEEFKNQKLPSFYSHEDYEEWEKKKITENKVLAYLKRIIKKQSPKKDKRYRFIKTNYYIKFGAYKKHINDLVIDTIDLREIYRQLTSEVSENNLILLRKNQAYNDCFIKGITKLINRKKREYKLQSIKYSEMEQDPELVEYINSLSFISPKDNKKCYFNELQKNDLGLILQKKYPLLNWQQGSGKTAVAYHYAKYQLLKKRVKNVVVLAPALATNNTWAKFLKCNSEQYIFIKKLKDIELINENKFIVISNSIITQHKKKLQKLIRSKSNKICLIFDESDENTNPLSQRTRSTQDIFRRCQYKILTTGTTTRNNIGELYSQIELLYNNSINMLNNCEYMYIEEKEDGIVRFSNTNSGEPFPARGGHVRFKACFCPGKASVFGIEKHNQDIYNSDQLSELVEKTMITRKFKEFAGDKYNILNYQITPNENEFEVHRIIIEEINEIRHLYFTSTGDSKKDAMLKLNHQIQLLKRACSTPIYMPGYNSDELPVKTEKIFELLEKYQDEKVAIGCTTHDALEMYASLLTEKYFERPLFIISGKKSFDNRDEIIQAFESTYNGILLCTQQSLKSSVNIPTCNQVIMESLQWNVPKMEQFYFRFIRFDSEDYTHVHFVNYLETIEQNIMALVLKKECINEFIKSGEVMEESEIFEEFDISESLLDSLLTREEDTEGKFHISWGKQQIQSN